MARPTDATLRNQEASLADLLADAPPGGEGISREELGDAYARHSGGRLPTRTLVRRLRGLVAEGRVELVGQGPSTRYRLRSPAADTPARDPERASVPKLAEEPYVPLTLDGSAVRDLIRRPIMERQPVGYDRGWLEAYRPGLDWLLPEAMRAELHTLGRTPDPDRPAGTYARTILTRLLVDLAWASSHLEGNTYSRLDTQVLIEFGQRAEGKDAEEAQMILNHKRAIELLVDNIDEIDFAPSAVRAIHAALSENLLGDPADEGRERDREVRIGGTVYVPTSIPHVITEAFAILLDKAAAIPDPFEQAFFTMVHLPYLQPFADVNKRTSRLVANIPLIRANLVPLSFIDVPVRAYIDGTLAVYELRRVELLRDVFMWAYGRSCAQYRVVRDATAQPDPIRLRYRDALETVVQDVVRGSVVPSTPWIAAWARANAVPVTDVVAFVERAMGMLLGLNEATATRARLRPSEYIAWRTHLAAVAG
jgi:fido (protein-threonine AMPylation protein)